VPDVGDQNGLFTGERRFDLRIFIQLDLKILQLRIFVRGGDCAVAVTASGEDHRGVTQIERAGEAPREHVEQLTHRE